MKVLDSRRLTGRSLHADAPGAVAIVVFDAGEDPQAFVDRWSAALLEGLAALAWPASLHPRQLAVLEGPPRAALMFEAAHDRLYAATELNEWAIARAAGETPKLEPVRESAAREIEERAAAAALFEAARVRGLPALLDDERVSIGFGAGSRVWPVSAAPPVAEIDWSGIKRIPIALVTGTNGKTTTARLLARMAREAGLRVANSSTDGLYLDGALLEAGDWTGPGAARTLLRRPEPELAVLEVARGGLLRRGIEVAGCEAAIITNVDRDHLGEEGICDLSAMASLKGVVAGALAPTGTLVVSADSPALVEWVEATKLAPTVQWFSLRADHPVLERAVADGGTTWTVHDGALAQCSAAGYEPWIAVEELPFAFGGRAAYNVANALGALAVAHALGLERPAVLTALRNFGDDPTDNPGRARVWRLPEGNFLLADFAHNIAGVEAIAGLVGALDRRVVISFAMAGDRSDAEICDQGAALMMMNPRAVVLREQVEYLRGREPGEVPQLLARGLRGAGLHEGAIHFAGDEVASLVRARELVEPGELVVLLVHSQRDAVERWAREIGAQESRLA